jgi:proteasome lid subunit RPN8/RPN11
MTNTEPMPEELRSRLIEAAIADAPGGREICGFVMKEWSLVFMPNVAQEPLRFRMDDLALLDFYAEFPQPEGIFHSHPDGREEPSDTDWDYAPIGLRYWIVTLDNVIEWDMSGDKPSRAA